ncbi:MAG: GNAT family N-acetyltransferase [Dehalococcoidia bacterium]
MPKILTDRSPRALVDAIEAAVVDYWRACCSYVPGAKFHASEEISWYRTGIAVAPWLNGVLRAQLAPDDAASKVDETLAMFAERHLPILWSVSPSSSPPDVPALLQARGLEQVDPLVGMAIDLPAIADDAPPHAGFSIERVRDLAGLQRWAVAYIGGFGMAEAAGCAMFDIYTAAGFADDVPFRHYVGMLNGAPVASSTLFLGNGVAGVWHVSTAQAARRLGIGAAMTLAPLRDARALGYQVGTLYASAMGAGVYRRLGFEEYTSMVQYQASEP